MIYEKVIKNQLVYYIDRYLSPFILAYRKNCSTQQVLICLLEEWRKKLDKNFIVDAIFWDLSKIFDCILTTWLLLNLQHMELREKL